MKLTAKAFSPNTVILEWEYDAPCKGFYIYNNGVQVNNVWHTGRSIALRGLLPQTTYTVRVAAYQFSGITTESEPVTVTTPSKLKQTISHNIPPLLNTRKFSLRATTTSRLPLLYHTSDKRIASFFGSVLTVNNFTNDTQFTVTISQAGDDNYEPVSETVRVTIQSQPLS